jgi:CRISPR-associated exonuclease Cas4
MNITATHINYYFICHRKLWLFSNGIKMEHTSEAVQEGKLLHETSYPQRAERFTEIEVGGSVIDFYDAKNKIVHEIKKSASMEKAHEWQVKYYIWLLDQHGVNGVTGILEYPKLRETKEVLLTEEDKAYIPKLIEIIERIISVDYASSKINKKFCMSCSYYEFCWVEED